MEIGRQPSKANTRGVQKLNIGIIIGRIGGIDGVALETEKWIKILKKLGHQVHVLCGIVESVSIENITIIPELDFHHPLSIREQEQAFFRQHVNEDRLISRLERETGRLETQILAWIVREKIEVLVSQNATALPCHLTMGWAIKNILEKTNIPCVAHNHDFHWERGDRYKTQYGSIRKLVKDCFPVNLPNVHHVVINQYSKAELKKRFNINAVVVPNVMDFNKPYAQVDDFNKNMLKDLGLDPVNDIPLFQITRIGKRKRIDTSIELISKLDDPNVKLVITGTPADDKNALHYAELLEMVEELQLHDRVHFVGDRFSGFRIVRKKRKSMYSIEDGYVHARACTYFSEYEGFGNAFVEAIVAKLPIFVNNYKPVYWPDLGSKGFETVMIENNKLTDKAVAEIKDIIHNPKRCQEIAEHNFSIGKDNFSFEVLEQLLEGVFSKVV